MTTLDTRSLAVQALDLPPTDSQRRQRSDDGAHDNGAPSAYDANSAPVWVPIVNVPDLPPAARLSPALERAAASVGGWVDRYVSYASQVSPRTPRLFHESAALWLGGLAIARRLRVRLRHGDIYPNLYSIWVAPTTIYGKTTSLAVAERLAQDAIPHLLISSEHTPEALLGDLAGHAPANLDAAELTDRDREIWRVGRNLAGAKGMIVDEVGGLFSSFRRDYSAGLRELILRLADAPDRYCRSTRGGGLVVVRTAALSLIGATTPARLRRVNLEGWWDDGLAARFALLTPDSAPVRPHDDEGGPVERPPVLAETLSRLASALLPTPNFPEPIPCADVVVDDEARRLAYSYVAALTHDLLVGSDTPDQRLYGVCGRLPTLAWKAATILAALDWADGGGRGAARITAAHWSRAQMIAESWRSSAHRALAMLSEDEGAAEGAALEDRVLRLVRDVGPRGVRMRDIYRSLHMRREVVELAVAGLVRDGLIVHENINSERGRPTSVYRAVRCQDD